MKTHIILSAAFSLVGVSLCSAAWAQTQQEPHWSYTNPENWGELKPDYKLCKLGKVQSPIDIRNAAKADLAPLAFDYRSSPIEVLNNGHTVQVTPSNAGGITLTSGNYSLIQFHFHSPSEEKIQGRAYPMVAHLVHRNLSGDLAVVAILFEEGEHNPALAPILAAMPDAVGATKALDNQSIADLLPTKRDYYAYMGSLTTPPCSENVRWHVLTTPVALSRNQLNAFQALYPMNARPVQPLNGRTIQVGG